MNPHLLEAWLAFWGAVKTAEAINHAHDKSYKEYRSILAHALGQLALEQCWVDFDSGLAAIGLTALLDGLWLEHGLDPDTFTPAEAVLICEAWIDGLLAGGSGASAYRHSVRDNTLDHGPGSLRWRVKSAVATHSHRAIDNQAA